MFIKTFHIENTHLRPKENNSFHLESYKHQEKKKW